MGGARIPYKRVSIMRTNIKNAQKINGWMSDTELTWLAERATASIIICEAGCYKGRSTMVLADNCPGVVMAVDPYSGDYLSNNGESLGHFGNNILDQFNENLKHHLESHKVIHVRCNFRDFVFTLKPDFIFLDGDHRYQTVKADICHAKSMILKGGILSGHDYNHPDWPGVKKAVDECFGESKIQLVDTIWWLYVE
jgi:hypothetical protein